MIMNYFQNEKAAIVRLHPNTDLQQAVYRMDALWKDHVEALPFGFSFLDADYKKQFEEEHATLNVLGIIAGMVILLSILGMYALLRMLVKAREKEMGIRKVNGASQNDLFKLLSFDFVKILLIGIGCSIPIFWFGINNWLEKYPLRISLSPFYFIATAIIILLIASLVIYLQASKAYRADTVSALKHE